MLADPDLPAIVSNSTCARPAAERASTLSLRMIAASNVDCSYLFRSSARCDHGVSSMSGSNASDLIGKSPEGRRLIAVVYADMVGYSRLIGFDDVGTLERLRTLRRNVIDPAIEEHGGRIVQTGGNSLLIVFDSIDGAARCAVRVQQQVLVYDGDQPAGASHPLSHWNQCR